MYSIDYSKKFDKSYKKLRRSGKISRADLEDVVSKLAKGEKLDIKYRDHKLAGNFLGYRECHIKPDVLLIYEIIDKQLVLLLINIGSHSELF